MFSTNFLLSRLLSSLASSSIARILFASLPLVFDLHISLTLFTLSFSVWIPAWTYFSGAHRTSWLNELYTTQICPNLRPTKSELNAPQIFSPTTSAPQDISSTSSILTEIRWKAPPSHLSQLLLLLRSWGLHVHCTKWHPNQNLQKSETYNLRKVLAWREKFWNFQFYHWENFYFCE